MKLNKISKKSVFRSLAAIAVSNTLLQLMGFLYRIFLSRVAGAEGLGVYHLIMPLNSVLMSVTVTGLTVAVSRLSAARAGVGDFRGAKSVVSLSQKIFAATVIFLAVLFYINSDIVSVKILGDDRTAKSLPLLFVCLFLTGIENIYKNYFYGVNRVTPQITSELSEQVVRALSVAALLFYFGTADAGNSAALIVFGMVISELSSFIILTVFYKCERRGLHKPEKKKPTLSEILSVAIPVSGAATVNNLLSSLNSLLIPRLLIASGMSAVVATESFGVMFGMTMPLLSFPIAFIASLTSVMVPKISEDVGAGRHSLMRRKAIKTIHATSLLAMPCMAILIPLGGELAPLLFGHSGAGEHIFLLALATLLSYYEMSLVAIMNGLGLQKRAAVFIVIGGIVQILGTLTVSNPNIRMQGFVVGYLASGAVQVLLTFASLVRYLKIRPRYVNWFVLPALAATLSLLICNLIYNITASIILAAISALVTYGITLSALGTNIIKYLKTLIPKEEMRNDT
ncbi:MAG: oligosaccharide flippase family protein [Oscillospiraceae bacterium]|nr:oligosaccharide flippase family protein [Oscillospiraceae bacterium]